MDLLSFDSDDNEAATSTPSVSSSSSSSASRRSDSEAELDRHLRICTELGDGVNAQGTLSLQMYTIKTSPLFSSRVRRHLSSIMTSNDTLFPHYGLLGQRLRTFGGQAGIEDHIDSPRQNVVYANTNAPWSTFICGQQGMGKSHTLSCLLENGLLAESGVGKNPDPSSGLVFHFDKHTSAFTAQICEAAHLASSGVKVRVFVSPTNLKIMQRHYGFQGVEVVALLFDEEDLTVDQLKVLMGVHCDGDEIPLYMQSIMNILRVMEAHDTRFSLRAFEEEIGGAKFSRDQNGPLALRLQLLEFFLRETSPAIDDRTRYSSPHKLEAVPGLLNIVDLSCNTISESDACALYVICLSIYLRNRGKADVQKQASSPPQIGGQAVRPAKKQRAAAKARAMAAPEQSVIVALDEAHKFMTQTAEARHLTESLLQLVRQQRHNGTRVVIATQEPTLSTQLIDLCDVTIVHSFRSPAWYTTLKGHLAGFYTEDGGDKS
jgi:hypothetical protein